MKGGMIMSSLYEIDQRLQSLEQYLVDIETGEIVETEDRFNEIFEEIQMDLNAKIENTACFIKNLNADIEAFKKEEDSLKQRRKIKENLLQRLKDNLNRYITYQFTNEDGIVDNEGLNKFKFETPKTKISYRKSESVNVLDATKIPKECITTTIIDKPNLTEIKKCIKNGTNIEGAELVTNINIQNK